jgi:hypothetical protein
MARGIWVGVGSLLLLAAGVALYIWWRLQNQPDMLQANPPPPLGIDEAASALGASTADPALDETIQALQNAPGDEPLLPAPSAAETNTPQK